MTIFCAFVVGFCARQFKHDLESGDDTGALILKLVAAMLGVVFA